MNPSDTERRRSRRFPLQQSAMVKCQDGIARELSAKTKNASVGGVMLLTAQSIAEGSEVEVTIRLRREDSDTTLRLQGLGKVLRVKDEGAGQFGVAVAYHHPPRSNPDE